jgi:hypothetical protein
MKTIVANYTEDVIWSNPEATTQGHEELNKGTQKLASSSSRSAYSTCA